jgi:hypothetical protein
MSEEFGYILAGALLFIFIIVVWVYLTPEQNSDYHSETKAYREDGRICDYYLEYQGQKLVNRTRLGCV